MLRNFKASLPGKKEDFNYKLCRNGWYYWEDKSTDRFLILSQDFEPWGKDWAIIPLLEQGKTANGTKYPKRIRLKCFPVDGVPEAASATILRERWKGHFAFSLEFTYCFYAFPILKKSIHEHNWLMISIIPK